VKPLRHFRKQMRNMLCVLVYGVRNDHCPIQKLYTIWNDLEITIQELRFRNYCHDSETITRDSETTIRKLFRAIQKVRLGNYFVRFRKYD